MNVSFTQKQEMYIKEQIASGDFQNASEVVRDALRLHETMRAKIVNDLKKELQIGWDSGISDKTPQQIWKEKKEYYSDK